MKFLPLAVLLPGLLLAGCSDADWDHALSYTGMGGQRVAETEAAAPEPQQAAAPAQAAAPDTSFCQAVAIQDASGDGFDTATRQRMVQRSFQQCMAMFGTPH